MMIGDDNKEDGENYYVNGSDRKDGQLHTATIPVFGPLQQMRFLAPNTCVWIRATDVVYGPKHEVPATGL